MPATALDAAAWRDFMLRHMTRKKPGRRGAVAFETAMVLSVCFAFSFGIFEYGRFYMMRQLMENAAREGARQASVNTNSLVTSDIQNTVTKYLAGQQLNNLAIQAYQADTSGNNIGLWTDTTFGTGIAVQVDADYPPMLPNFGILPHLIHITVKANMRSEAN
jgi:Flp pilus assembly protein TadG